MTELLTAAQMRAIEQAAIDRGEVTGLELMERAGQGVVDAIFDEWPELAAPKPSAPAAGGAGGSTPSPLRGSPPEYLGQNDKEAWQAVVLCGPGNNGGDGFVIARLLKEHGWDVDVFLYGDAEKLPPDAKTNHARLLEVMQVRPMAALRANERRGASDMPDLVVDALFGTGLTRSADSIAKAVFAAAEPNYAPTHAAFKRPGQVAFAKIIAVDVPSGCCADSGRYIINDGRWWRERRADLTVTFAYPKVGHYLASGPTMCGKLRVVDIGVTLLPISPSAPPTKASNYAGRLVSKNRCALEKAHQSHKYSHGHALILSGGVGKGGAARLAARGALRVGAGAVTVGCPPSALIENAAQLNAVMLSAVKDEDALWKLLKDARMNALCLGPGLGVGEREAALIDVALSPRSPGLDPGPQTSGDARGPGSGPGLRHIVLDADALTLLAQDKDLFAKLHDNCVLTPHAGEFARLFPDIAEKLNVPATKGPAYSKVDATREAAARAGCVVLFKGPDTVIADPSGRCSINASVYERTAPWLATAGSGDVLAGFITGLLARGFAPMQAAETGAWLHTECALRFGPGLIAEDLPEELPNVFRALGL